MKALQMFLSTVALGVLGASQAQAAVVAVMPVQGVNLTEGQCDAIGVLFANALARVTNVAVVSPLDIKPLLAQGQRAPAAASQLGVREYMELRAVQLGTRITLAGIRYTREGQEMFRAETVGFGMDDMELATARLAHSLAWRQPIAQPGAQPVAIEPLPESVPLPTPIGPQAYPKALGIKTALIFPTHFLGIGNNLSYAPMVSLQFDGRVGSRFAFVEFGVGAAIPASSVSGRNEASMGGVFIELGGAFHLAPSDIAPYIGGGISPRLWFFEAPGYDTSMSAACTVHTQFGITFARDSRVRPYAEVRLSQYVLGLRTENKYYSSTYYTSESAEGPTFYPTELSLQVGFGW